jgi:hypothetical protein
MFLDDLRLVFRSWKSWRESVRISPCVDASGSCAAAGASKAIAIVYARSGEKPAHRQRCDITPGGGVLKRA